MKITIVGGVAAGMSAASKASRMGKDLEIAVYEKTDVLSYGACGMPYYVGDFFQDPSMMIARTKEEFEEQGIKINIFHEVLKVSPEKKVITVKNLKTGEIFEDSYDKLMIATGARAFIPPIKNADAANVFTLKYFQDALDVKKVVMKDENQNIIIVGGGYIGLETAEAMVNINKKSIRILQFAERILDKTFDKEMTDIMEEEIKSYKNISLHIMERLDEILTDENGKTIGVKTNKGEYPADVVIIAAGIKPNTEFLEDTGIEMLKNGALIINSKGETSVKDIYSAGDCASVYHKVRKENMSIALATTANKIGRIVGENMAGGNKDFPGTLGSAAIKVMKLEAGRTGIGEGEAKELNLNYDIVFIKGKNQTSYYPGGSDLYVKLIYNRDTRVILGGQIVGRKGAVLRVDALAVAVDREMTVDDLALMDFCYAPPFSRTRDILNDAAGIAK